MPRVSLRYASKRKPIKRRKFVARKRRTVRGKNLAGSQLNPFLSTAVSLNPRNAFPSSMRQTLKYSAINTLTSGTGLMGTQQAYLLNSIYDPDYTGGGHQPYGHDQMALIYNKYRVLSARVELVFTTPGAANDLICVAAPSSNTSGGMTGLPLYQIQEWPNCQYGIMSSSGERRVVLKNKFDLAELLGVSKATYLAGDEYEGTFGASPSKNLFYIFNMGAVDGTGSETCKVHVLIYYDVLFYDRTTLGLS